MIDLTYICPGFFPRHLETPAMAVRLTETVADIELGER